MKIAVRALVLGMLITGFAADHMAAKSTPANANATVTVANSAAPMPMCDPAGSSTCGL